MKQIFFEDWYSTLRTIISTILAYIALITMLRISGKRTLAKMYAFDLVITVAIGSSFATVALSKDVALLNGTLVFLLLILMQFILTWLSVRSNFVKKIVVSQPVMLLYKGEILDYALKKERITIEDLYAAARIKGIGSLQDIDVIVLETTGDITVMPNATLHEAQTLTDVKNHGDKGLFS